MSVFTIKEGLAGPMLRKPVRTTGFAPYPLAGCDQQCSRCSRLGSCANDLSSAGNDLSSAGNDLSSAGNDLGTIAANAFSPATMSAAALGAAVGLGVAMLTKKDKMAGAGAGGVGAAAGAMLGVPIPGYLLGALAAFIYGKVAKPKKE